MVVLKKFLAILVTIALVAFSLIIFLAILMYQDDIVTMLILIVMLAVVLTPVFFLVKWLIVPRKTVQQIAERADADQTYYEEGWCAEVTKINVLAMNSPKVVVSGFVPAKMVISPNEITVSRQGYPDVIFNRDNIKVIDFVAFEFVGSVDILRMSPRRGNSLLFSNVGPSQTVSRIDRGLEMAAGGSSWSQAESLYSMAETQRNTPIYGVYEVGVMRKRFGRRVTGIGSSSKAATFGKPIGMILLGMGVYVAVVATAFSLLKDLDDTMVAIVSFLFVSAIVVTLMTRQVMAQRLARKLNSQPGQPSA